MHASHPETEAERPKLSDTSALLDYWPRNFYGGHGIQTTGRLNLRPGGVKFKVYELVIRLACDHWKSVARKYSCWVIMSYI